MVFTSLANMLAVALAASVATVSANVATPWPASVTPLGSSTSSTSSTPSPTPSLDDRGVCIRGDCVGHGRGRNQPPFNLTHTTSSHSATLTNKSSASPTLPVGPQICVHGVCKPIESMNITAILQGYKHNSTSTNNGVLIVTELITVAASETRTASSVPAQTTQSVLLEFDGSVLLDPLNKLADEEDAAELLQRRDEANADGSSEGSKSSLERLDPVLKFFAEMSGVMSVSVPIGAEEPQTTSTAAPTTLITIQRREELLSIEECGEILRDDTKVSSEEEWHYIRSILIRCQDTFSGQPQTLVQTTTPATTSTVSFQRRQEASGGDWTKDLRERLEDLEKFEQKAFDEITAGVGEAMDILYKHAQSNAIEQTEPLSTSSTEPPPTPSTAPPSTSATQTSIAESTLSWNISATPTAPSHDHSDDAMTEDGCKQLMQLAWPGFVVARLKPDIEELMRECVAAFPSTLPKPQGTNSTTAAGSLTLVQRQDETMTREGCDSLWGMVFPNFVAERLKSGLEKLLNECQVAFPSPLLAHRDTRSADGTVPLTLLEQ